MSKIKHVVSVTHCTIYVAVSFQFTHVPCDDWDNKCFVLLSSSKWKLNYCPLFMVRSWNSGMRCMSLYILMNSFLMKLRNQFSLINLFFGVFLDFSKELHTVDHVILVRKLSYHIIRDHSLAWYQSYLANIKKLVTCNGVSSTSKGWKECSAEGDKTP